MKLTIDNLDGRGARDYTAFLDGAKSPRVLRKLNSPTELRLSLVTAEENFVVPVAGARVTLGRTNGSDVFSGYIVGSPTYQYLGWGERGPLYRYEMVALSDESTLPMTGWTRARGRRRRAGRRRSGTGLPIWCSIPCG